MHEEDPLRVLKRLEADGWMKHLAPLLDRGQGERGGDSSGCGRRRRSCRCRGSSRILAAANFPMLTAKLTPKEVATLKAGFPRQGFVRRNRSRWTAKAREFAALLNGKGAALPSQAWKLLTAAKPESVLAVAFSTKSPTLQAKLKSFHAEWPQARQKMPYTMMQEMRIVPELAGYDELLERLFFELMDGNLSTPEEMKAFLEPYSPPAPPPPVSMRRPRASKKDAKPAKSRSKKAKASTEDAEKQEDGAPVAEETEQQQPAVAPIAEMAPPAVVSATVTSPINAVRSAPAAKKEVPAKVPSVTKSPAKTGAKKAAPAKVVPPAKKSVAPAKGVAKKQSAPAKKVPAKAASAQTAKGLAAAKSAKKVVKAAPSTKAAGKKTAPAKGKKVTKKSTKKR